VPEAVSAEMVRVALPGLLKVIVCDELPPTATFPNATLAGLAVIWGAATTPVPVSEIVAGEFVALLVTVMLPDPLTADAGAYFAANVADCPGVKVSGTVIPDSENPVPLAVIWEIVTFAVPALVSEIFCEALPPTLTLPKAMVDGFAFNIVVVPMPVPVRPTDCGELGALLLKDILPDALPVTVGANFAVNDAVCPAFTVTGAGRPLIEYPVPEADIELIVSVAFPVLEIVTDCEELPPTATFPKPTELGAKVIRGCPPVPVSGTIAGELGASLVTVILPEDAPIAWGEYCTVNI
jgi:hypothetical protein